MFGTLHLSGNGKRLYAKRRQGERMTSQPPSAKLRQKYTPKPDSERAFALRIGVAVLREHSFG